MDAMAMHRERASPWTTAVCGYGNPRSVNQYAARNRGDEGLPLRHGREEIRLLVLAERGGRVDALKSAPHGELRRPQDVVQLDFLDARGSVMGVDLPLGGKRLEFAP
jgi:hypothetical protein